MPSPPTPRPGTLKAVHHYEDRLLEFAMACAVYGRHDPETALWNARRALEAACLIVHCLQQDEAIDNVRGSKHPPKALDLLLREIRDLRDPHATSFRNLQQLTNLGVHVRLDGRRDLADQVNAVQEQVRVVLGWLYDRSLARPHLAQGARRVQVEHKLRGPDHNLSPHLQLAEIERLLQEVVAERDAQRARVERAEIRADEAERERDKLLAERKKVAQAARRLRWLRWRDRIVGASILGGSLVAATLVWALVGSALMLPGAGPTSGGAVAGVLTTDPAQPGPSASGEAAGTAARLGAGGSSASGDGGAAPGPDEHVDASSSSLADDSGPAQAGGAEAQLAASAAAAEPRPASGLPSVGGPSLPIAPADPAAVPTCPTGTVLVPATTIRIGQPTGRTTWPAPSPAAIAPIDVPAFCIDRYAARWSDLATPLPVAKQACASIGGDRARCVTRDEAERACMARGLRLPRLAEWEAVLRAPAEISTASSPKEWVEDRYPPRVLNRFGPAPQGDGLYRMSDLRARGAGPEDVWWSWNQQPPDPRYPKVGFRCAADAAR